MCFVLRTAYPRVETGLSHFDSESIRLPPLRGLILALLLAFAGCRSLPPSPALPEQSSVVRDQLVINSDFGLPKQHRLLDELAAQRLDLSQRLQLPPTDEPIHVYLFS